MCEVSVQPASPATLRRFQRELDGKIEEFYIKILTESDMDKALEYLCKYFSLDEPISKALKCYEDDDWHNFTRNFWQALMKQKVSMICYKKTENAEDELVAISVCQIKTKGGNKMSTEGQCKNVKIFMGICLYIDDTRDPFLDFGIDKILSGAGLFTMPKYRGHNIGLEMLHARRPLCSQLGIKVSTTIFTAPASQRLAAKAGFKDYSSITYEELGKINPEFRVPNIQAERIKLMYIVY